MSIALLNPVEPIKVENSILHARIPLVEGFVLEFHGVTKTQLPEEGAKLCSRMVVRKPEDPETEAPIVELEFGPDRMPPACLALFRKAIDQLEEAARILGTEIDPPRGRKLSMELPVGMGYVIWSRNDGVGVSVDRFLTLQNRWFKIANDQIEDLKIGLVNAHEHFRAESVS
ncbi:MAG: hypothetical protein KF791_08455 [Verrucomicrobiae bacterium]|nr:hypothetical protein [Verrucomicrobiae bacterium]